MLMGALFMVLILVILIATGAIETEKRYIVFKTNGKEAAKKLLEKFGAAKVTELKPEDYAAVMKEVS